MKNIKSHLYILLLLMLTGCISVSKITVQLPVAAEIPLSDSIQSLVLMNRSLTPEFIINSPDSLEDFFVKNKLKVSIPVLDSLASDTLLISAGSALFESGRFDAVIPVKRNLYNGSQGEILPPLSPAAVGKICSEFNTNGLLVLEKFSMNINSYLKLGIDNISMTQFTIGTIEESFIVHWRLYIPEQKMKVVNFQFKDTIVWNADGESLQETYDNLPSIRDVIKEGAVTAGKMSASYLSPYWRKEFRYYFKTNNQEADKAIEKINQNQWSEALKIWNKFSNDKSSKLRSQIEYNMALAYEMTGRKEEAIVWVKKSLKTRYSQTAEYYLMNLQAD